MLNLAAEKAGWATPPAAGWTRGVAVHESFGSVVAQIAEVKLEGGVPKVGRVVTAIDCGTAISPDQIAAQMEGGTCLGLAAALFGQITLKDGVVDQKNFDTYRVLRMNEAPTVETYILPSDRPALRRRRARHAGHRPGRRQRPAGPHRQADDQPAVREGLGLGDSFLPSPSWGGDERGAATIQGRGSARREPHPLGSRILLP